MSRNDRKLALVEEENQIHEKSRDDCGKSAPSAEVKTDKGQHDNYLTTPGFGYHVYTSTQVKRGLATRLKENNGSGYAKQE